MILQGKKVPVATIQIFTGSNNFTAKWIAILARVVELSICGGKYPLNSSINLSSMYRRHDTDNCRNREMACKIVW
jgi:hypothetical protein